MEVKYCPKCHAEAYRIKEDGDNIQIIQGRKTIISVGHSSNVSMSINCPNGHPVKLEIKKKEVPSDSPEHKCED